MASTHLSRKDLKNDALAAEVQHGVEVVAAHKNQVYLYAGAVVLAIAGYVGYNWYSTNQAAAREQALWEARKTFSAAVGTPNPTGMSFATQEEKDKASAEAFTKLADKYPSSSEGAIAMFRLASEKLEKGKTGEAATMFREIVDKAPKEFSSMAKLSLSQILWQQGKTDEAKKMLEDLIASPTTFVSPESATLTLARLQGEKNPEEARKLLEKLGEARPAVSMAKIELAGELPPAPADANK